MNKSIEELAVTQLRRVCESTQFNFESTAELPVLEAVVGQDRAVRAVTFGIEIESPGYHIYALGPPGTGKSTTIHAKFQAFNKPEKAPENGRAEMENVN